jgi:hypothetical protein
MAMPDKYVTFTLQAAIFFLGWMGLTSLQPRRS